MLRIKKLIALMATVAVLLVPVAAQAASSNITNWTLPAGTGNATTATEFVTTSAETNISVKVTFFRDSQDISCWPVKPDGTAISGSKTIKASQLNQWITLATNVKDGTRFKLRCGAVGLTDQVVSLTLKY